MNDLELWQLLKKGDKTALERIYRSHAEALLRYGSKFVADQQLVEDCLQDLFVDLWRKRENLSDTDHIKRYLLVALRRNIVRQLERKVKKIASEEPEEYLFEATISIDEEIISKELNAEQTQILKNALAQLSERQKEAIYLKYYSGLDYEAICEIMDISYQSVRNVVSSALKALRKYVQVLLLVLFQLLNFGAVLLGVLFFR